MDYYSFALTGYPYTRAKALGPQQEDVQILEKISHANHLRFSRQFRRPFPDGGKVQICIGIPVSMTKALTVENLLEENTKEAQQPYFPLSVNRIECPSPIGPKPEEMVKRGDHLNMKHGIFDSLRSFACG